MKGYNICIVCKEKFPHRVKVNGVIKTIHKRKYCFNCRPINWKQIEIERRKIKKVCRICKIKKPTMENFHKNKTTLDGVANSCKQCRAIEIQIHYQNNKEQQKQYYQDNKEHIKIQQKQYYQNNKKEIKQQSKQYYESNKEKISIREKQYYQDNKEQISTQNKQWRENNQEHIKQYNQNNKEKINERERNRFKNNIHFKIKKVLRSRTYSALKNNQKAGSTVKDLGCSVEELKEYLEFKFQPGMTWENWRQYGWHIDHVKPLASFDLTDRKQFLEACSYKNLQPMWAEDNLKKSNKLPKERNENENMFDISQTKS